MGSILSINPSGDGELTFMNIPKIRINYKDINEIMHKEERTLVLAAGGAKASYSLGVLDVLSKYYRWNKIYAASAGGLLGMVICSYPIGYEEESIEKLMELWLNIDEDDIYNSHCCCCPLFALFMKSGVLNNDGLKKMIDHFYDEQLLSNSDRLLNVGAVNLETGDYETFSNDDTCDYDCLKQAIIASAAIPIMFETVEINDHLYTDSAVRNTSNILKAIEDGASKIDVLLPYPEKLAHKDYDELNSIGVGMRMLEIMNNEIINNDIEIVKYKYPDIDIRVFRPDSDLEGTGLDFNTETISRNIERGKRDTIIKMEL